MLFGIASTGFVPCAAAASQPAFDPKPWLEDLAQAQEALSTKYANLEWVVFEHEIDLTALFAETKARVESASDAADARASFDRLARKLGDGHVRFRWSVDHSAGAPRASCGALGFDPRMQGQPLAALMPGYSALASAPANEFPSGIVQVAGHRVGVLKIGLFSALGYPELCDAALAALNIKLTSPCNDECSDRIEKWASDRMTSDLAAQLSAIKVAAGAEVLLVDVADNGGGTEWAEAAARMVTAIRLKSERVGFVRGPHWAKHFSDTQADLRSGGILELPDCARLRADGSNEMLGIQPDVLVGLRTTDGPHRQATRAFQKLPEAIERALQATSRHAAP